MANLLVIHLLFPFGKKGRCFSSSNDHLVHAKWASAVVSRCRSDTDNRFVKRILKLHQVYFPFFFGSGAGSASAAAAAAAAVALSASLAARFSPMILSNANFHHP